MDLEPMKNEESCYVPEEEDDGIDRVWYKAVKCPDAENCSDKAWKKAACRTLSLLYLLQLPP